MSSMYINLFLAVTGFLHMSTEGTSQIQKISGPGEVTAGVSAVYECSATCTGPCNYEWNVEGQTFSGSTFTLTADGVSRWVTLACTVSDEKRTSFAVESKLVRVKNPFFVKPSKDQLVLNPNPKVGGSFKLTCDGTSPSVTIIWLKDGDLLTLNSRMNLSPDNTTLSFSQLNVNDRGQYQCRVLNGNAMVISMGYRMDFAYVVVSLNGPGEAEVGFENVFTCKAMCGVDCTPQWAPHSGFPKGRFVTDGPKIYWTPSELGQIQNFTCIAFNAEAGKLAEVSKMVTVVEAKPRPHPSDAILMRPSVAMVISGCLLMLLPAYV